MQKNRYGTNLHLTFLGTSIRFKKELAVILGYFYPVYPLHCLVLEQLFTTDGISFYYIFIPEIRN